MLREQPNEFIEIRMRVIFPYLHILCFFFKIPKSQYAA